MQKKTIKNFSIKYSSISQKKTLFFYGAGEKLQVMTPILLMNANGIWKKPV